jgi:hypothetical protein
MVPSRHYVLFRDEPGCWCAVPPAFRNTMLDPLGCGKTPQNAITDLLGQAEFLDRADEEGWRLPVLADFVHLRQRIGLALCGKDCESRSARDQAWPWPPARTGFL